ncbi:Endoribonuclease L-PSP (plasmid) [Rhizobium leguminosarum bv. trifolii WSM2304]|uniref:Endoribonuclease L-PSP n=1 Tax=Rhizobium leguminosarum bv. trifolii (strain WSM2304) TaxID=395492 RepID=A0ABF7R018_RHILW|nr:RidA family protein [Rhizobium leguminosarum]ACI59657.1 Endoribonuclease L-PSP [Rhizobium leguminosarum bv. trifolii WSM2304]
MLKALNPPQANWPGLSQGMLIKGSGYFVSGGHCGLDDSGEPVTSSMEEQIVAMFEGLKRTLAEAGLGFEHVARTTCFVREFSPELLRTIKEVRARYYNSDCPPASVMVQAGLYDPKLFAEIEVIAAVP